jgi:hypothetical protein
MSKQPVLGIIALDVDDATEESSTELAQREAVTPWVIDDPSSWTVPFVKAIAHGANPADNKIPTPEAADGIVNAAERLDRRTQMIIGDCGYMWASSRHLRGVTATPTLTSGLDLLDLALGMTNRPVGVITWAVEPLVPLLRDHPGWERLRLVGLNDLPTWRRSVSLDDYMKPDGWTLDTLDAEFRNRLAEAFADGGAFADVGLLVVECTCVANFRSTIRSLTPLPVLDIVSFTTAALA